MTCKDNTHTTKHKLRLCKLIKSVGLNKYKFYFYSSVELNGVIKKVYFIFYFWYCYSTLQLIYTNDNTTIKIIKLNEVKFRIKHELVMVNVNSTNNEEQTTV